MKRATVKELREKLDEFRTNNISLLKLKDQAEAKIKELERKVNSPLIDHEKGKLLISDLVTMRDDYSAFAADHTRVASMRQMSAEFALKLSMMIRQVLNQR